MTHRCTREFVGGVGMDPEWTWTRDLGSAMLEVVEQKP